MRMIDADAYADELKRREKLCFYQIDNADVNATVSEVEYWSGVIGTFNEAMCVLADAPTVGGWVSVKDGLPEDTKQKIVFHKRGVSFAYFSGNYWWSSIGGRHSLDTVTHWMPLPEPPKEDEE